MRKAIAAGVTLLLAGCQWDLQGLSTLANKVLTPVISAAAGTGPRPSSDQTPPARTNQLCALDRQYGKVAPPTHCEAAGG